MVPIEKLKKIGGGLTKAYEAVGAVATGVLAISVIFTVIMRYCFSLSWKELSEFNIVLFTFTTFWGMGFCVIKDEHVVIDILYDGLNPKVKRIVGIIDYLIVLAVVIIFTKYGFIYTKKMGVQISMGMEIPMKFMYGIMPVSGCICALTVIVRIITMITADISYFAPKNAVYTGKEEVTE